MSHISIFSYKKNQMSQISGNQMSHAEKKLEQVEKDIKELKPKRDLLLDKEIKLPSEIAFLDDFKKLESDKKYWQGIIEKSIIYVADYRRSKGYDRKC